MRLRLTKVARTVSKLDRIADYIEKHSPKTALALDRISDQIEKTAFSPMGWLPGRGGPGRLMAPPMRRQLRQEERLFQCAGCGRRVRGQGCGCFNMQCPTCGARMMPLNG